MIQPCDGEDRRDDRDRAQDPALTPTSQRVGIDKSIWNAAAETEIVAVLERLRPANPAAVEKGAARRLQIGHIVAAARVANDRMAIGDARVGYLQSQSLRAADYFLVATQEEQPGARGVAIDGEQTCGLRPSQHVRLLLCGSLMFRLRKRSSRQNTNAFPLTAGGVATTGSGAVGVSVPYGTAARSFGAGP